MRVSRVVGGLTVSAVLLAVHPGATVAPEQAPAAASTVEAQRAFVQSYCVGCHNDRVKNGGFSWTELDVARPDQNATRAEAVIRKVRAGLMPPAGARRPDAGAARGVQRGTGHASRRDGGVASVLQGARAASPQPARVPQRRPRRARRRRRRLGTAATRRAHRLVRQHGRRAHHQPGADAGLHPRRRQGGAAGARRSEGAAGDGQIRRAQGGEPDAPHRGRALRHARRHGDRAPLPRRRHLHLPERALLLLPGRADRRQPARVAARAGAGDLDRRPARPCLHHRPALRRQHRSAGHAADCRHGRPAPRRRRLRRQGRRRRRRLGAPGRTDDPRRQRRPAPRHDDAAASADADHRRPDAAVRRLRHAEPPPHPHLHAGEAVRRGAVRHRDRDHAGAARLPSAADQGRRRRADADVCARPRARHLRGRHPHGGAERHRPARVHLPVRARARRRDRRAELPRPRPRAGVAAVVFPVGRRPRRRPHRRRRQGRVEDSGRARTAGQAHARRPSCREPVDALRGPVAAADRPGRGPSGADDLPRLHPQPGAVDASRSGAAVRQRRARGPQHRRAADRRLHLRGRDAGAPLRHPERGRAAVPPRDADRSQPLRPDSAVAPS